MVLTDGNSLPLSVDTASASPREVTLIEPLLENRVLRRRPRRLIYDDDADSDPLRTRFETPTDRVDLSASALAESSHAHKTAASCGATVAAGRSNDRSVGCKPSAASSFATNTTLTSSTDSSNSPA
ncbi:MAG: hypothetical protein MPJ50_15340 [Pirellulales bacterium]|nr:hypothetical protein [Pirellulales bacterium]